MAALPYDTQGYQQVLFIAPSFEALLGDTARWLARDGRV